MRAENLSLSHVVLFPGLRAAEVAVLRPRQGGVIHLHAFRPVDVHPAEEHHSTEPHQDELDDAAPRQRAKHHDGVEAEAGPKPQHYRHEANCECDHHLGQLQGEEPLHQLDDEHRSHAQREYRQGEHEEEVANTGADESYRRGVIKEHQGELAPGEANQVGNQAQVGALESSQLGHTEEEIEKVSIQQPWHPQVQRHHVP